MSKDNQPSTVLSVLGDVEEAPAGLGPAGERLWHETVEVFDFGGEPHKLKLLERACRTADLVDLLDAEAAQMPLTAKGSQGQAVINPLIAEARQQQQLLAQLFTRLGLPESDADAEDRRRRRSAAGRTAAKARWGA